MNARILVIDDEEALCEILKFNLEKEGYDVDTAHSAEEALEMDLMAYDLFLTDIMMEKLSGFDFAKRIRHRAELEATPIIFCTALTGEDETVMGLNIGADDYITKPFVIGEVLARVRAVLRRSKTRREPVAVAPAPTPAPAPAYVPQQHVRSAAPAKRVVAPASNDDIVFKGLVVHSASKLVTVDGSPVNLTKTEYSLLFFFLTHPDRIYSREEIIKEVWSGEIVVTSRTIDTNITRLRKKIGAYGKHIVTRLGFGYGFKEED